MKNTRVNGMDKKEKETLGAYLRREREAREIKLSAVSKATKISLPLLAALEADDQNAFPDKKVIPDYLKRYCRYLLMDEQEALKCFESHPAKHLPEITEIPIPEVVDLVPSDVVEDIVPAPAAHPSYTLPPSVISSVNKTGFFRRFRLVFVSLGVTVLAFLILSGLLFYFHPLRDMGDRKEAVKAEVPRAVVKHHAPAVKKEKVIANRDSKLYHLPGMKYYHEVKAFHRVEFDSEDAAIKAGYHKAPR